MISLIVARAQNGAIGRGNTIPWFAPEDLAFFQRETTGGVIIMGRRTWESLPVKPLKNRLNLVVSSDLSVAEHVFASPDAAIAYAYAAGHRRVYGIGGQAIYQAMMPLADRLLVTQVGLTIPDADAFFPDFSNAEWRAVGSLNLRDADPACTVTEYLRR